MPRRWTHLAQFCDYLDDYPKGLAGLSLQYCVIGGETIRDTTYMAVLVSITLTALLVMLYPLPGAQKFYSRALGKPVTPKTQDT